MDSLLSEPPRKLKNTVVVSLSLFKENFLTQQLNPAFYIAGRFFTSWPTREAQCPVKSKSRILPGWNWTEEVISTPNIVGWLNNGPSQRCYILILGSCEYVTLPGKRDFEDVISYGSWDGKIILGYPCETSVIIRVLKRRRQEDQSEKKGIEWLKLRLEWYTLEMEKENCELLINQC